MSSNAPFFCFKRTKMSKNATSCSRVSDDANCQRCKEEKVIKNGRTKNNKQQYYYKICFYRFIENDTYQACKSDINQILRVTIVKLILVNFK